MFIREAQHMGEPTSDAASRGCLLSTTSVDATVASQARRDVPQKGTACRNAEVLSSAGSCAADTQSVNKCSSADLSRVD
jgi:hypothetical protein